MDPLGALGSFLGSATAGMPNGVWLVAIGGGVLLAVFVLPKIFGNKSSGANDSGNPSGTANSNLDPNIDPNTNIPYSIESAINPNTGLPAYYGGAGVTNQNPPPGGADLSQIWAALNQIQNEIANTQQNPSGPGGIPLPPGPTGPKFPIDPNPPIGPHTVAPPVAQPSTPTATVLGLTAHSNASASSGGNGTFLSNPIVVKQQTQAQAHPPVLSPPRPTSAIQTLPTPTPTVTRGSNRYQ